MVDSPRPGGGVDVGRDGARRLRLAQLAAVTGLADGDVAGRQVGEHGGAGQRAVGAGRDRRPHVLADLDEQREVGQVAAGEHEVGAERNRLTQQGQLVADEVACRPELALFVVLAVLGQIALGDHAQDPATVDDHRGVEQTALGDQGRANHDHRDQPGAGAHDRLQAGQHRVLHRALVEEVLARVGGQSQLREDRERGSGVGGALGHRHGAPGVELRVADSHVRDRGRDSHEAVVVRGMERDGRGGDRVWHRTQYRLRGARSRSSRCR